MTDIQIPEVPMSKGGGSLMQNAMRSGLGGGLLTPSQTWWVSYKLKVLGSGYWDTAGVTALAAATSQTVTLGTTFPHRAFPTNVVIEKAVVNLITLFAGGTIASFAIDIGDAGQVDEWFDGLNVFTGATLGWYQDVDEAASAVIGGVMETAYAPLVTIASGTGDVNELTAGELDIHFKVRRLPPVLVTP